MSATLSLIVAMAENGVIGIENRLPWHLPEDMKWFRRNTLGKPVLMGRKTFESIGRPLPGRVNLVLSRDPTLRLEGVRVVAGLEEALAAVPEAEEVMVMGGAEIYRQTLSHARRLYLTLVHGKVEGDAHFPPIDWEQWRECERHEHIADADHPFPFTLLLLERKANREPVGERR